MFGSLCIKASYARESISVIRTRVRRESEIARNCLVLQEPKTVFVTQLNSFRDTEYLHRYNTGPKPGEGPGGGVYSPGYFPNCFIERSPCNESFLFYHFGKDAFLIILVMVNRRQCREF